MALGIIIRLKMSTDRGIKENPLKMATSMALKMIIRLKMPTDRGIRENPLNKNKTTKSAKSAKKCEKCEKNEKYENDNSIKNGYFNGIGNYNSIKNVY